MNERVIPFTPSGVLWSQREYVRCTELGIGFAAHRDGLLTHWFHYAFPEDIGCTSVLVSHTGVARYIDHAFSRDFNWINRCRAAVASKE
jgi:hypothetical protein